MGNKQIRTGQLIAPFGPGSLYTDRTGTPQVVCGLDHWFKKWDQTHGLVDCEDRVEFEHADQRLAALLHVDRFCTPPDHRMAGKNKAAPPNAFLNIPAQRFPCWYRHTATGELHRFNLDSIRTGRPKGGGRWQPVRFVAVCAAGHLCEFPWKEWIGCQCTNHEGLRLTDRGGSELSSIRIACENCPAGSTGRKGKSLAGTTIRPDAGKQSTFQKAGINCPGDRPWLGRGANEVSCGSPLVGALINQTNLYFPRTIAAIGLPDLSPQSDAVTRLKGELEGDPMIAMAMSVWKMGKEGHAAAAGMMEPALRQRGIPFAEGDVLEALGAIFDPAAAALPSGAAVPSGQEPEILTFRRAEFDIIRNQVNDPEHIKDLRVIPAAVPDDLTPWFGKVNLVERLRETRVFYGFDRLEQINPTPLADMPDSAMRQLFRHPPAQSLDRWLPAIRTYGEGIYLELSEERLAWWQREKAGPLAARLDDAFIRRLAQESKTLPPSDAPGPAWATRYLLVHSLAHILINQLVYECGYGTASLRERLYVSADPAAPMAGILIYTAAGDSEGTLGGLVRLGRPDRLGPVVRRALSRASWCSADPVCSEHLGGQGSRLANLAACHACVLLPETSCETINQGLDRAMVVGLPDDRSLGFFSELLDGFGLDRVAVF
ncbi:MAG: DUF1998 domain-containing protein [Akkermansiaceae bacterium]|nr:DUF1998 domain-containing protein [Akkermansiaceae bacterium]